MNVKLKDGDVFTFMLSNSTWEATVVGGRVKLLTRSERDYKRVQWAIGVEHRVEECVKELEDLLSNPDTNWRLLTPITNTKEKAMQESKQDNLLSITQDIYFDVAKHAKAWDVAHWEASKIIQKELFKTGRKWRYNPRVGTVAHTSELYLYAHADDNDICWGDLRSNAIQEATLQASTTYTLNITESKVEEEKSSDILVEFSGKKYSKADIEKALALLQPKEEG